MKKSFLLIALLCVTTLSFAQTSTLTATLKHGDNITAFYGINALVEAHEAASAGDVITLSSGTFNPTYINRAITLRGAGCVDDPELSTGLTNISGRTSFNIENVDQHMTIEGIYFTEILVERLYSPTFIRCNVGYITSNYGDCLVDAHFFNCIFKTFRTYGSKNTLFENCIIHEIYWNSDFGSDQPVTAYNSYLKLGCSFNKLIVHNCIIVPNGFNMNTGNYGYSEAYNCVSICNEGSMFDCPAHDCWENKTFAETFASFTGEDYDWATEQLILTDYAASTFLGPDGTQVGVHGGSLPYAARPTYMVPARTSADHETTPDGKLNVHIEVISESK